MARISMNLEDKKDLKILNITQGNARFAVQKNLNLCQTGELRNQESPSLRRDTIDAKSVVQNEN